MNLIYVRKKLSCGYFYKIYTIANKTKEELRLFLETTATIIDDLNVCVVFMHDRDDYIAPSYFTSFEEYKMNLSNVNFDIVNKISLAGSRVGSRFSITVDFDFSTLCVQAKTSNEIDLFINELKNIFKTY